MATVRSSLIQTLSGIFSGGTTVPVPPSIADHRIVRLLGQGGMGSVYLAEDTTLERRVAVKVLRPEIAADGEARKRFLREARSMAKVEHQGIVSVYSFGEADDQVYLVMQYIDGIDLQKAIKRKTGARGLRSIMEDILLDTMFDLPSMEGVEETVINGEVVVGDATPLYIYADLRAEAQKPA